MRQVKAARLAEAAAEVAVQAAEVAVQAGLEAVAKAEAETTGLEAVAKAEAEATEALVAQLDRRRTLPGCRKR
mgnify:CR=1 FL=1